MRPLGVGVAIVCALITGCGGEPTSPDQPNQPTSPPFSGTIFLDPDIITSLDPTSFLTIGDMGRGVRTVYDRRESAWGEKDMWLFDARFSDGLRVEVRVNPEFGAVDRARELAQQFSFIAGQLPAALRDSIETITVHDGVAPFGGGNRNLLIHQGQAVLYLEAGILEETLVHEASHAALDRVVSSDPGWLEAQRSDPVYISDYARDFPGREDVAESFLVYLAVRARADRISDTTRDQIVRAIPARLEVFDRMSLTLEPTR